MAIVGTLTFGRIKVEQSSKTFEFCRRFAGV